jgi:hypothetical protein
MVSPFEDVLESKCFNLKQTKSTAFSEIKISICSLVLASSKTSDLKYKDLYVMFSISCLLSPAKSYTIKHNHHNVNLLSV